MFCETTFVDPLLMAENERYSENKNGNEGESSEATVLGDGAAGDVENPGERPVHEEREVTYQDEGQPASPEPEPAGPEQQQFPDSSGQQEDDK